MSPGDGGIVVDPQQHGDDALAWLGELQRPFYELLRQSVWRIGHDAVVLSKMETLEEVTAVYDVGTDDAEPVPAQSVHHLPVAGRRLVDVPDVEIAQVRRQHIGDPGRGLIAVAILPEIFTVALAHPSALQQRSLWEQ